MLPCPRLCALILLLAPLAAACSDNESGSGNAAGGGAAGVTGGSGQSGAGAGGAGAAGAAGGGQAGAGQGGGAGAAGSAAGAAGEAGAAGQAGSGGGEACPAWPGARLGDSAAAKALAADPARCGQPAHQWLDDPALGTIKASKPGTPYKAALLSSLVTGLIGDKVPQPKHDVATRRFTYTTQDRGKLVEATGIVAMPAEPTGERPDIVAVLHGTTGFTDGCGPAKDTDWVALLAYIASLGYVAVSPDYLGLRTDDGTTGFPHPYLSGQPTAIASLDSIRAAGHLAEGLCPSGRYAVIGGSQGGHAALWVDRLAPYYAGELSLRSVVATVPPADLLGEGQRALSELVSASSNTAAFLAVSTPWYGQTDRLDEAFVPPKDTELPAALAASCDPDKALDSVAKLSDVYQPALLDAAAQGKLGEQMPFGCITAENGLTTTSVARITPADPAYGILFVLGESDTLVHTPTERVAFTTLCEQQQMPLSFLECAGASHTKATTWALPEILAFTQARLAGEAFEGSCQTTAPVTCQGTPSDP